MRMLSAALALACLVVPGPGRSGEMNLFTLGAGDVGGSYYASAAAICDAVNLAEKGAIRCSPDPTAGSIYNMDALRRGQIDFAFAQSDLQRHALMGTGIYADEGPMPDLVSVLSLYSETLTLLVGRDSGVTSLSGLRDKRVDIGPPASGRRGTVDGVLATLGYAPSDFATVAELPTGSAMDAVCQGTIDATLLVLGHPNEGVARAIADCGARLVALSPEELATIRQVSPDMAPSVIRRSIYPGMTEEIPGIAVVATVVTLADADPLLVGTLVRDTLGNLPILARQAPVLRDLDPQEMRSAGLSAPLHPAAAAAFDAAIGPAP